MGILERIRTVLKSNINALISKAEDPEKMLNQLIIDMNEQLLEAKKQVAMAIADEKKLERQTLENKGQAEDWEKKAMLAVKAGKDDLAKEALLRKQEYDGYASSFQKEYDSQHTAVEQLKDALRQLSGKIDEASRKKNLLIARAKRAEAQKQIQQTMGSLSAGLILRHLRPHGGEGGPDRGGSGRHEGARRGDRGPEAGGQVQRARVIGLQRGQDAGRSQGQDGAD